MATRDSLTVVRTKLAMELKTFGKRLKVAIAAAAVSVSVLLLSDKTIAFSNFLLGESVVVWLLRPTCGVGLLSRDLPLEGKVRFGSGIGEGSQWEKSF